MKFKKKKAVSLPFLEQKAIYFNKKKSLRKRKQWYFKNYKGCRFRVKLRLFIRFLASLNIPFKMLDLLRWLLVDFLRGKGNRHWGIYCYIANPGEGKTLSMVAHMQRVIKDVGRNNVYIATNFYYENQDVAINHWVDMIRVAKYAVDHHLYCVIAMDEIHITFDASDWKSFPPEMLALLSFNRKYDLQFLCSAQRLDRIPKKIVGISNYVVLCKNVIGDRYFRNYYFKTSDYEAKFSGKRKHADFIRSYVAGDDLYNLYNTKAQVDSLAAKAEEEKDKRQEAFDLLFGINGEDVEKMG